MNSDRHKRVQRFPEKLATRVVDWLQRAFSYACYRGGSNPAKTDFFIFFFGSCKCEPKSKFFRFHGSLASPVTITSYDEDVFLIFKADDDNAHKGFSAKFKQVKSCKNS